MNCSLRTIFTNRIVLKLIRNDNRSYSNLLWNRGRTELLWKSRKKEQIAWCNQRRDAGNFQRPEIYESVSEQFHQITSSYLLQDNVDHLRAESWNALRLELTERFRYINKNNIDAIIVNVCAKKGQLSLAKDYIQYLQNHCNCEPNDGTWSKLLRAYNAFYHRQGSRLLDKYLQEEIFQICDRFRRKYPILDSSLCENLIMGLVATDRWRDGLELLEMAKITTKPTNLSYTELTMRSFLEEDMDLGWSLCENIVQLHTQPKCEIFLTYLNKISASGDRQYFLNGLDKFLQILSSNALIVTQRVVDALFEIHRQHPDWFLRLKCSKLKIQSSTGFCSKCRQKLATVGLSEQEFEQLREAFSEKVLLGGDVFQKSTPDEIKRFQEYVRRTAPYDCVIDGLNVAYSMGRNNPNSALANLLVNIVRYFVEQEKSVLVLGRKHMANWPSKSIQYLRRNTAMFLAEDLSQDDPFLLYATLYSGQNTDFFSRDLMRQHAHLLGAEMKQVFRRWQQEHQYSLLKACVPVGRGDDVDTKRLGESGFTIKEPVRHVTWPHRLDDGTWHLPYKEEYTVHSADTFESPKHWICLKL